MGHQARLRKRGARAQAQSCTSTDPNQWPASSKPYFLIIADTSGSMSTAVAGLTSCGYESNRLGHLRCAISNVVKAFVVLAEGNDPSDELAQDIQGFVRQHLSAYAYPRRIEFTDELPKTLTGKIRRIELREREKESA